MASLTGSYTVHLVASGTQNVTAITSINVVSGVLAMYDAAGDAVAIFQNGQWLYAIETA